MILSNVSVGFADAFCQSFLEDLNRLIMHVCPTYPGKEMPLALTENDFENCVPSKIWKTAEAFNLLKDEIVIAAKGKALQSVAIQDSRSAYVPHYWNWGGKGRKKYKNVMWVGFAHRKFLRKRGNRPGNPRYGVQLQFGIGRDNVPFNGIWIEGGTNALRSKRTAQANLKRNFAKFRKLLRKLPRSYYVYAMNKYEGNVNLVRKEVHRLSDNDLMDFVNYMGVAGVSVEIGESVTREHVLGLSKRGQLLEYIIENFSKLLPLYSLMIAEPEIPSPQTPQSSRALATDVRSAEEEISNMLAHPYQPVENRKQMLSGSRRLARDKAFARLVLDLYGRTCAVCGSKWVVKEEFEAEAAHVRPVHRNGSDDLRNGIALCRFHHWAFDKGIFSLTDNLELMISTKIAKFSQQPDQMLSLSGRKLTLPTKEEARPSVEAVQWHRRNVFIS
jgi:hypothetical protein